MYNYDGFNNLLKKKGLKKSELSSLIGLSSRTIAKISKGQKLSKQVIKKLCIFFSCNENEIYQEISDNAILQILREEKKHKISGGLYHELQIRMTYNSNHIEGNSLSEEQTRHIFETNTISSSSNISVDEVMETVNHFRAISYCIDIADENLSEEIIKKIHFILENKTSDEMLNWFNIGEYKSRANTVGGIETTKPSEVKKEIQNLLKKYNTKKNIQFEDIVEFHYLFECIHPFQDGNGRVGRLIAFKECLKHNIIPFIIEYDKKYFYYRGLKEYSKEKGYLIDTCYDGQDTFKKLLQIFEIE